MKMENELECTALFEMYVTFFTSKNIRILNLLK